MGVLVRQVKLAGDRGSAEVRARFDSGASFAFLRRDVAERVVGLHRLPEPRRFGLGRVGATLEVREFTAVTVELDGFWLITEVLVAADLAEEFIIGARTMQSWMMKLDFGKDRIEIDPEMKNLRLM